MDNSENLFKNLLKEFKPILVIYFPYYYVSDETTFLRIEALKNKLGKSFGDKYVLLTIPYQGDDFKLDLLSVVKSEFIRDKDLEKYIKTLQDKINKDEQKSVKKTDSLKDAFGKFNKMFNNGK